MKKVIEFIKNMFRNFTKDYKENPFYCSAILISFIIGIYSGLRNRDKSNKEKIICTIKDCWISYLLGALGFMADYIVSNEKGKA